ncbi:MAG: (2Fe-2S)-binding protein [Saccharofermentanales bacterium]
MLDKMNPLGRERQMLVITLHINGQLHECSIRPELTLLELLRREIGFLGTKNACNSSHCGACTVLLNGRAVYACTTLAAQVDQKSVITIEGISCDQDLHPLQKSFAKLGGVQCGFCTPGMIMAAKDLLDNNPDPTEFEIKEAISGNLCRCTGYTKIVEAVADAAEEMRVKKSLEKEGV